MKTYILPLNFLEYGIYSIFIIVDYPPLVTMNKCKPISLTPLQGPTQVLLRWQPAANWLINADLCINLRDESLQ